MTKKNILLISFIVSAAVFAYLSNHHYDLALGESESSFCQVNQTINCDKVALSSYSEYMGIPLALFGFFYSIYMIGLLAFEKLGWIENSGILKIKIQILTLSSLVVSLAMALISWFILKSICPFCTAGYILAILQFILAMKWSSPKKTTSSQALKDLISSKSYILSTLIIPFLSWFTAGTLNDKYGFAEIKKLAPEKVLQWQNAQPQEFDLTAGLIKGNLAETTKTIVEFADFKCPHCKSAYKTIKSFASSNNQFKIVFKPYPLDGNCNPHVNFKGDGSRCQMAGLVLCAEKLSQKGWQIHDFLFDNQEKFFNTVDMKSEVKPFATELGLNFEELSQCVDSAETFLEIKKIVAEGQKAKVDGTPSIYIQNKKIIGAQIPEVLRQATQSLQ